jgi:hypothetical protein
MKICHAIFTINSLKGPVRVLVLVSFVFVCYLKLSLSVLVFCLTGLRISFADAFLLSCIYDFLDACHRMEINTKYKEFS